ncbi:hypothetical protein [Prauserella cavernicola]|uniref:Uncharacterized protein n=1 Tax=Prauserella cavernicola TaxID=2800127 RepID=A0A934V585_9PSEU|nr:hypothetical protein [Prauserella cavernicola]MBK1784333.1 hypothetical protein [Prauserella cavernicola]
MAPKVLRCTPHDADMLDRSGILGASVPGGRYSDDGLDDGAASVRRVNRSGIASLAAAALMAVVAFGAVFDGPLGGGAGAGTPMAGEAVAPGPVVIVEQSEPTQVEGKARPAPGAVPAPEVIPEPSPVAVVEDQEPQPEPVAEPEPAPEPREESGAVIAAEAPQAERSGSSARADLPARSPHERFSEQMRELIDPMLQHYLQQGMAASASSDDRERSRGYDDDRDDRDESRHHFGFPGR